VRTCDGGAAVNRQLSDALHTPQHVANRRRDLARSNTPHGGDCEQQFAMPHQSRRDDSPCSLMTSAVTSCLIATRLSKHSVAAKSTYLALVWHILKVRKSKLLLKSEVLRLSYQLRSTDVLSPRASEGSSVNSGHYQTVQHT